MAAAAALIEVDDRPSEGAPQRKLRIHEQTHIKAPPQLVTAPLDAVVDAVALLLVDQLARAVANFREKDLGTLDTRAVGLDDFDVHREAQAAKLVR